MQAVHAFVLEVLEAEQEREWQVPASDKGLSEVPYGQVSLS